MTLTAYHDLTLTLMKRKNIETGKPYLHSALFAMHKDVLWHGSPSLGEKLRDQFTSSLEGHSDPESPIAFVALLSTAV